jgi:hypothetical protein
MADAKITGFTVRVSRSEDYQTTDSSFQYEFDAPVSETDAIQAHAEAFDFVAEAVKDKLAEVLDRSKAESDRARDKQARSKAKPTKTQSELDNVETFPTEDVPGDEDDEVVVFQTVQKRGGKGQIKFRPTSNLSQGALKAMVEQAIQDTGADPDGHVVWDNRTGKFGIEDGHAGYGFATVNPTESNPAYQFMLNDKGYPRASFYVDFNDDGTIRVTPSKAYKEAIVKVQNGGKDGLPF